MDDQMLELRIAHLSTIQQLAEQIEKLDAPIKLITGLGVEGVQHVAQADPELVLTALTLMHSMLGNQQELINELTELWYKAMDDTNDTIEIIMSHLKNKE